MRLLRKTKFELSFKTRTSVLYNLASRINFLKPNTFIYLICPSSVLQSIVSKAVCSIKSKIEEYVDFLEILSFLTEDHMEYLPLFTSKKTSLSRFDRCLQ